MFAALGKPGKCHGMFSIVSERRGSLIGTESGDIRSYYRSLK